MLIMQQFLNLKNIFRLKYARKNNLQDHSRNRPSAAGSIYFMPDYRMEATHRALTDILFYISCGQFSCFPVSEKVRLYSLDLCSSDPVDELSTVFQEDR